MTRRSDLPNRPGYGSGFSEEPKVRRKTFAELSALIDDTKAEAATSRTLLRIALAYVESYAGRFPENVRTGHLKRFRRWRLEDNKRSDAWMSAEKMPEEPKVPPMYTQEHLDAETDSAYRTGREAGYAEGLADANA